MTLRPKPSAKRLEIEHLRPRAIKPRARNPRTHSQAQIGKLMEAIRKFGFTAPVLVDAETCLIAGHGRLEAALKLGLCEVPAIRIAHLSPREIQALVIADNQLAALSKWDDEILKLELGDLIFDDEIDFSPSITGFEGAKIDALVFGGEFAAAEDEDLPAGASGRSPITQLGDIWQNDQLTLICGDALKEETYQALLGAEKAAMALTDPPYNVAIDGHVSGKGKVRHREFAQASGEMSEAEFIAFLSTACERIKASVSHGALIYVFMDGAHLFDLMSAARSVGLKQLSFCTWAKTNAGMGSFYRSQTEHVLVLKAGDASHTNNIQLGRFGRNRTTLWTYPGANSFGRNRDASLAAHPTVKNVAMLADAILDATNKGDLVLDPFAGSGSTLVAAHRVGRRAAGIELDPLYVDGALQRIIALTGLDFERASDGASFADLMRQADAA